MNMCITRGLIQPVITGGALLALATSASAGLVSTSVNSSDPFGAEASFLDAAHASITEDFEPEGDPNNYRVGAKGSNDGNGPRFNTDVGTFDRASGADDGQGGQCESPCQKIWVMDNDEADFSGRYDTTTSDGDDGDGQWLDSNDVTAFTWDISSSVVNPNAFGFFLMDPSDVGATLTVSFDDGGSEDVAIIEPEDISGNGELFYISAIANTSIASATVKFANSGDTANNDGFGIDDATVARVPEPGTLGLLGAGLMGIGIAFRSRRPV